MLYRRSTHSGVRLESGKLDDTLHNDRYPATSDAESPGRNSPGAGVRHPGNGPIAVVLEPATPADVSEPDPTAAVTRFGTGGLIRSDVARARPMSERSVRWMPALGELPLREAQRLLSLLNREAKPRSMSALARLTIAAKQRFRSHTAPRPPVAVPKDRIVGPLALYVLHRRLSDRGRLALGLLDGGRSRGRGTRRTCRCSTSPSVRRAGSSRGR